MLAEFIQLPKEGDSVGPYLLRKMLSSSIMGSFYQATHKLKHENVLLHILPEAIMRADSRFEQRYREALEKQKGLPRGAAMAAVESLRISGNLVVQYPAGNYRSLNEVVLERKDPLPEERVSEFLTAIGEGLQDATKINQGHYFMTPDFLFVNEDGDLRIAGTGLFQSMQYEAFERFVSGAVVPVLIDKEKSFTALEILSPEIRNFKARDLRSDFYCIGMVAHFLLTGKKPERRWATPTKDRKEIGEGWDLFINRCLEPKPSDRFPNYKTFLQDLQHIEDLEDIPNKHRRRLARNLKSVPLPKRLDRMLSIRSLMLIRLVLLGVAGVLTIWTASLFYQIIFSDFDSEVTDRPIRRVTSPEQANLILSVSPGEAMVIVRGPESGRFVTRDASLYLRGRSGRYTVSFSAPRYRTLSRQIELEAKEPVRQHVQLTPDFVPLRVNAVPGTDIYVLKDDLFLLYVGTVEDSDDTVFLDRLLPGKYQFVALHPTMLPTLSKPTDLVKMPVEVTFDQPPRPTELTVRSEPTGAMVYLDGELAGTTPLDADDLDVGRPIRVRVEKEGYRPAGKDLIFTQGEEKTVLLGPLEPKIGTLAYTINLDMPNPPDLREIMLTLDETLRTAEVSDRIELREGMHTIRLEHPDYYPLTQEVKVLDREITDIELVMEPKPLRLQPVIAVDNPARFLVNDKETELTEQGYLPVPPNRRAKVEAVIRDYLSVVQWFSGRPNERMEWDVPLRPIPGPEKDADWKPPYFDLPMTWLPAGTFTMGSPVNEFRRLPNEDTTTKVSLGEGFWIGRHEVTQGLYERVMRENPSQFTRGEDYPVDSVTWEDATEFCRRLTEFEGGAGRLPEGYVYRLPTEAEWEFAARAGTETPFSFGAEADPSLGNFHGFYSPGEFTGKSEERYGTLPVASFAPNAFGLYDVHGNVAEWTVDRFWDRHPGGAVTDPVNTGSGRGYTIRGGSWRDSADRVRSAAREGAPGSSDRNSIGFRVVLAPTLEEDSS